MTEVDTRVQAMVKVLGDFPTYVGVTLKDRWTDNALKSLAVYLISRGVEPPLEAQKSGGGQH